MNPKPAPNYLSAYPQALQAQVQQLIAEERLGALLHQRYPRVHAVRSERALYDYVLELKNQYLKSAPPLSKVCYDGTLHVIRNALGLHTAISRVQGSRLKAKREIRVAGLFRAMPEEFLRMIVVHELAHLKERDHDKAFYQLCCHMEPAYHQLEFDLRAYLCWLEATGKAMWV